jgi:hypothetical protein
MHEFLATNQRNAFGPASLTPGWMSAGQSKPARPD